MVLFFTKKGTKEMILHSNKHHCMKLNAFLLGMDPFGKVMGDLSDFHIYNR